MTCENCIHQNVCVHLANDANDTYAYMGVKYDFTNCKFFKDKSEWVRLPCKVCQKVWFADCFDDDKPIIHTGCVYSFSFDETGTWIFVQYADGLRYWHKADDAVFKYQLFFTKEEAEKALEQRRKE